MKNIIYILSFLPLLVWGQLAPSTNKPYMRVSSARIATNTESDLEDHTKATTTIQYMDGLSRQMQTVSYKASPTEKDILMGTNTLDNIGRVKLSYLPVSTTATDGKFQSNAPSLAQIFYNDTAPYDEVETYESSPLSRPFKVVGAGQAFRPTLSAKKGTNQTFYTAGSEVRKYLITEDINGNATLVNGSQNFTNGDLLKTTTTDEEGNTLSEFTDKEGRIIEKRVISATNSNDILITAYVYDDLGRLRYVIPPKAYQLATQFNETDTPNADYFKNGVHAIRYDTRSRIAEQHTPSGGWNYIIYNELDQVVMTQNAFQRESNLWQWMHYDGHGRGIMSGTWISNTSRTTMQSYFLNFLADNQFEERSTAIGDLYGYTNRSFPSSIMIQDSDIKQVYYFDDYTWVNDTNYNFQLYQTPQYTNVKGLPTGSIVRLLNSAGTWLKSVVYYDDKNRAIQSIVQNRFGSLNQTDRVYNFSGDVLEDKTIYRKPNQSNQVIKVKYALDHVGRVTNATLQYNNDIPISLANYRYDEIGRLIQKRLQEVEKDSIIRQNEQLTNGQIDIAKKYILLKTGTYTPSNGTYCAIINTGVLQIIDYAFNIRGQLKSINGGVLNASEGDIFAMRLDYHEDNRYFNGLLSKQTWQSNTQLNNRAFTYTYDGFTRVKDANYSGVNNENYSLSDVLYDANGNITNLLRNGLNGSNSYGQIDNLTYMYPTYSNRLDGIRDDANKAKGFKDNNSDSDYGYYSDGKVKVDGNRGITNIIYNYLGLPQIVEFGSTKSIEKLYDAEGSLLRETFINGSQTINIDYMGGLIYRNDSLKSVLHDEGRIAFKNDGSHTYQFFLQDHLGNTRAVVERLDANTALVQETHYGAWGEILEGIGQTGDWNFLYQGKEYIEGYGYDFHARNYDGWSGRFDGIDPINNYSLSGYAGMMNNPLSYIDPDGREPITLAIVAGAAVIGGGLNLWSNWSKVKNWKQGLAYFGSGAVGGVASVFGSPALGGSITAGGNIAIDIATGHFPKFKNSENPVWDGVKYFGGVALDGFSAGGAGSLSKLGYSKLSSLFLDDAVTTISGKMGVERIGKVGSEIFETALTAEIIVKPAVKGVGRSFIAQTAKQGLNFADDAGKGGLNLFKFNSEQALKSTGWKMGDRFLRLQNKGTPKLNWKQNAGFLREEMGLGRPIFDSYLNLDGTLKATGGFLNAERSLLNSRGWIFNSEIGAWLLPK